MQQFMLIYLFNQKKLDLLKIVVSKLFIVDSFFEKLYCIFKKSNKIILIQIFNYFIYFC